jgi:hypothetical protein
MTTNGKPVNWEFVAEKGAKPQDPLDSLFNTGKNVLQGFEAEIEQAMNKSMAMREAEAKFGNPGSSGIEVRHEGMLHRENPEDRKRYEAQRANLDRGKLTAQHLKILGGFVVSGEQFVLDVGTHLSEVTDNLPAHMQPVGQALTNASMKVLTASFARSLTFLAERGFDEIDQATPPGRHQQ